MSDDNAMLKNEDEGAAAKAAESAVASSDDSTAGVRAPAEEAATDDESSAEEMDEGNVPVSATASVESEHISPENEGGDEVSGDERDTAAPADSSRSADAASVSPPPATVDAPTAPASIVKEIVVEKERPLTAQDKEIIFKDRLQTILADARTQKHQNYEKNLALIVDFIRARQTLVTNQDIEEGLTLSDTTVTNRLNVLIRRGIVVRLGDPRHAKYRLTAAV